MDLIYCDKDFVDVGILQAYSLDMAYGSDENNFVIKMELKETPLEVGQYIYIDGTEYGGIIDAVEVDTKTQALTYSGRTWYGILASHIVKPPAGSDYYVVQGEAQVEIRKLISSCTDDGLRDIKAFDVAEENQIELLPYQIRYDNLYEAISGALANSGARLQVEVTRFEGQKWNYVQLTAVPIVNYSAYDEFESEIVNFKIKQNKAKINHLVCLGSGEMRNRHVIDLYTDENGNVQDYLLDMTKEPVKDSDYIFDTRNQLLFDDAEYALVYDYPNAQTIEHYTVSMTEPPLWAGVYLDYYTKTQDGYRKNEWIGETVYLKLTTKPSTFDGMEVYTKAWDSSLQEWVYTEYKGDAVEDYRQVYAEPLFWDRDKNVKGSYYSYYTYDSDFEKYVQIEPEDVYTPYNPSPFVKPADWEQNFGNYYTTDGVHYTAISAQTVTSYVPTEVQPSDWHRNWGEYYIRAWIDVDYNEETVKYLKGQITAEEYAEWTANHPGYDTPEEREYVTIKLKDLSMYCTAYELVVSSYFPEWAPNTYLVETSKSIPPEFLYPSAWNYKQLYTKTEQAPDFETISSNGGVFAKSESYEKDWQADVYYRKVDNVEKVPEWKPGIYYKRTEDHYYDLVQNGLKKLKDLVKTDTLEVSLKENDNIYYIGDTILAKEHTTGIEVSTYISKKIITVERGALTVRYEVS